MAIRTGIDINLDRVALSKSARLGLPNWLLRMIARTWLLTYVVDGILSAQFGKPTTLRDDQNFQRHLGLISQNDSEKTIDDAWVSSLAVRIRSHFSTEASTDNLGMEPDLGKSSRCTRIWSFRFTDFPLHVVTIYRLGPCIPRTVPSMVRIIYC
jgi:hypothetical protein